MDKKLIHLFHEKFILQLIVHPDVPSRRKPVMFILDKSKGYWCWRVIRGSHIACKSYPIEPVIMAPTGCDCPHCYHNLYPEYSRMIIGGIPITKEELSDLEGIYSRRDEWFPIPIECI